MNKLTPFLLGLLLLAFSNCQPEVKFDKQQWAARSDMSYPYREQMLSDLLENQPLRGLAYSQLIELLGTPTGNAMNGYEAWYEIVTDYGSDIDPMYVKNLVIQFTPDSVVTGYKIQEWSKE